MVRIGINPARNRVTDYRPARVTVAVLTYIPMLGGYFQGRLDVLKLCLASIVRHTEPPYDLLVFDNASCAEVKQYLRELVEAGTVRYLITSTENVGKLGALRLIFGAAPGEVVAYCDDDTFFYPGWLPAHLALLDAFPRVGMVSGSAWKAQFDHGIRSNLRLPEADRTVRLTYGQFIPEEWELDYALTLGRDPEEHLARVRDVQDIVIEGHGVRAFAAASHNQFVAPKAAMAHCLEGEWTGRLMGGMNELDNAVDDAGHLRLATFVRKVKNMGGTLTEDMVAEAARLGISATGSMRPVAARPSRSIVRWRPIRRLLQGVYNRLFWVLNQQSGGWVRPDGRDGR
jgi:hypothetical protein